MSTDQIVIPECDFDLYLPTAITPSDYNGVNDYFYIPQYSQNQIKDFEIFIYNRWGGIVFHSTDKNFRWNGNCNGKIMTNNTFTYIIHYTKYNGKDFYVTGIITII